MNKQGGSTRLRYDECAYRKELCESTSPYAWMMYNGKFDNEQKCRKDKYWRPFDPEVVDVESDLSKNFKQTLISKLCKTKFLITPADRPPTTKPTSEKPPLKSILKKFLPRP